ncbi:MAG: hypothetical protein O7D30_09800 [Rickettsia endosymbiont of Ixodes persulcatus]|nr:hypothetical protein [Rickettsia endosymbiont of Ixodes persulcatus]
MNAIKMSGALKHEEAQKVNSSKATLKMLAQKKCKYPGLFIYDINDIKAKLESIGTERYKCAVVRVRSQRFLTGEMPTMRALATEKK